MKNYLIDFLHRIDALYPEFINDCNRVIEGFADELNEISKIFHFRVEKNHLKKYFTK